MDVKLVASQTKVAPLQKQSIPRLELVCAMILVRLAKTVQNAHLASEIGNRVLGSLILRRFRSLAVTHSLPSPSDGLHSRSCS